MFSSLVASQRAHIRLSGVPLGGTLEGDAEFSEGEGSHVVVHEPLRGALRRRFVRIAGAEFDRETDTVVVVVKLPLLLVGLSVLYWLESPFDTEWTQELHPGVDVSDGVVLGDTLDDPSKREKEGNGLR